MEFIQILVLALVQGLTEFLPVSSSAHLILVPILTGWEDQGLAFDVAVHVGTLSAVVIYFRAELGRMTVSWLGSVSGKGLDEDARLAWAVLFGTIPAGLAGLLFKDFIELHLRSANVLAAATLVFALLLWWADAKGRGQRDEYSIRWLDVVFIGLAQALALIPGTSRSGVTITAGLFIGLNRQAAARFSFLLSIPVIVLAGGLKTLDYLKEASLDDMQPLMLGAFLSGVSAYFCIHYFLKLLEKIGMMPFVIYRIILAAFLFVLFSGAF
ncbi:Undecaprenyl-diphosphatase [hydrothermal vent metagenome]|uniref:Undecaprenyl-diphosphatase n=1 Tax=hydrothermal vent metagenome TaxID=652676 RepID=A0A3B0WQ70_9ZZZZ